MAARSNSVKRLGKNHCDICRQNGSERSPLTRHHCDGNPKNNDPSNFMVVHRILCHTFADFVTQLFMAHGHKATQKDILHAWSLIALENWLIRLLKPQ